MEVKPIDKITYLIIWNVVYFNQQMVGRNHIYWSKYTTLEGVVEINAILRIRSSNLGMSFFDRSGADPLKMFKPESGVE